MIRFEVCTTTAQWGRFTDFYIRHRTRIIPFYRVGLAVKDVRDYMTEGRAALILNENDWVVGIGSFVLGLQEDGYKDKNIAVLGNSFFVEEYRNNRTFVRGLQKLAEQIEDANPHVREVRIPTAADNDYTNRLYRKMAAKLHTYDSSYGKVNVYATSFREYKQFCSRFS
ncbi:hypothetical protein [Paenibacillus flagellatus]|uniref:N-acetyltransferase domain-containing protein n=1 Tax=Paenibacillus flagellatus TaxID=2211139 RepID=A0A2V5K9U6_9BACL|nr:hypothetical protein [Paenibacillus flagellatus]PYI56335.1 hypothetical protein DLM86_04975 [Paenibacillus flagellatus]